jgi:hypothetical protein
VVKGERNNDGMKWSESSGEGASTESEERGKRELRVDAAIQTEEVELTSERVAEQPEQREPVYAKLSNELDYIVVDVHRLFQEEEPPPRLKKYYLMLMKPDQTQ